MPNGKIVAKDGNLYANHDGGIQWIVGGNNYSYLDNRISSCVSIYKESKSYTYNVGRIGENTSYNKYDKIIIPNHEVCLGLYIIVNINIPTYTIHLASTDYSYTVSGFGLFSNQNGTSTAQDTKQYYSVTSWDSPSRYDYTGSLNANISLSTAMGIRSVYNIVYNTGHSSLAQRLPYTNLDDLYIGATFVCYYSSNTYIDIPSYTLTYTSYYLYK